MDAVALTKTLLQFDTINPPGRERDCAHHAGAMLQEWGYKVEYHEYAERRTSVIARGGGNEDKAPLCLTGHLDAVSPENGSCDHLRVPSETTSRWPDMKAGVAAI